MLCGNAAPTVGETTVERKLATYAGGVDLGVLRMLLAAEAVVQDYRSPALTSRTKSCKKSELTKYHAGGWDVTALQKLSLNRAWFRVCLGRGHLRPSVH